MKIKKFYYKFEKIIFKNKQINIYYFNRNLRISKQLLRLISFYYKKNIFDFIFSGGKTFIPFFKNFKKKKFKKISFYLSDERLSLTDIYLSNKYNIDQALKKNNRNFGIQSFNKSTINSKNRIKLFDRNLSLKKVAFLGIGLDGHVASLFDESKILYKGKNIKIIKNKKEIFQRITLNEKYIRKINKIIFVITQKNKLYLINRLKNKLKYKQLNIFEKIIKNHLLTNKIDIYCVK